MHTSQPTTGSRWRLKAGLATAAAVTMVAGAALPAFAASVLTLSATTGPSGGLNTITATAPSGIFTTAFTPAASFQYGTACGANYLASAAIVVTSANPPVQTAGVVVVSAPSLKRLSTTKISITVPSGLALATNSATPPVQQPSAKYNLCVYNGTVTGTTGSTLVGSATYTIAAKAVLTSITPATGPALGGTSVSVVGSGFPATGMTATIGGAALTSVVVNSAGTGFTATTPAHVAAVNQSLAVVTSGGTTTKTNAFAFTNGIVVSPNTSPSGSTTDLDVQGVGFSNLVFSALGSTTIGAHVFLVPGAYDPTPDGTTPTNKAVGPIAECGTVLPVSDTELICTLNLSSSLDATGAADVTDVANGTYTVTVVSNGLISVNDSTDPNYDVSYTFSIISSGSTFTVADY